MEKIALYRTNKSSFYTNWCHSLIHCGRWFVIKTSQGIEIATNRMNLEAEHIFLIESNYWRLIASLTLHPSWRGGCAPRPWPAAGRWVEDMLGRRRPGRGPGWPCRWSGAGWRRRRRPPRCPDLSSRHRCCCCCCWIRTVRCGRVRPKRVCGRPAISECAFNYRPVAKCARPAGCWTRGDRHGRMFVKAPITPAIYHFYCLRCCIRRWC